MAKAVFHDPQRKRWKHLRIVFDVAAAVVSLSIVIFVLTLMHGTPLPNLLLPDPKRPYRAIKEKERRHPPKHVTTHRGSKTPPSQVVLNSAEGIRGAFYVTWDAGSFSALKAYYPQIDLLFPEWLHVMTTDGRVQGVTDEFFDVVQNGKVHPVDDKVMPFLKEAKAETEVFPLVNNFQPITNEWLDMAPFLMNPAARANFRQQILLFLASDKYRGLSLDIEGFPGTAQPGFRALVTELEADLHGRGLKLYVNVPANDDDFDYKYLAAHSDGLILMDYDEHSGASKAGPIASQDWFVDNLETVLKLVPKEKLMCGIGAYGYDWVGKVGGSISVQDAWLRAHDSEAEPDFDGDSMNPHFAYRDEKNQRHDVWWLDAVTALNQMRAAQKLGINTFALWRLGSEDRSLWAVFDVPAEANAPDKLKPLLPGYDVDMEGSGEIIYIEQRPQKGQRELTVDGSGIITDETIDTPPLPYQVAQYGAKGKTVAITFDDGPDPIFTPKILDVLQAKGVKATFFLIGAQMWKDPALARRIYREGHEIGNHTFYHPDISNISKQYMKFELNMTELLFKAKLGVKPLLFRPPYSIDQEPDTSDEVRPLEIAQDMGYITVGDKIDPSDWKENPHRTAQQITDDVMAHLPPCKPADWLHCGNIILLHDGGGDRTQTVKALPMIIDGLRARGYNIVPVSALMGKQVADVMPPISADERFTARVNSFVFWLGGLLSAAIVIIFFLGDTLMMLRLLFVGALAIFDRLRERKEKEPAGDYRPPVAVLIPAFNEEKVIVNTVHAVLGSDYPALRVIVVDDGSRDNTYELVCDAFQRERDRGQVLVLTKENSGKAEALNFGLAWVKEEIFIGIDADTIIAPDAISKLVSHFADPDVAAVAGNTKVGNRVNLWTRWQALEYITSQNFERRALNVLGAVTVVPGAIGAWRTEAVRAAGGFHPDTVAEDADLTMSLLEHGGRVHYEDRALAWTEAPTRASGLMRQRFRWSFGILQSVWKHRRVFAREGTLGWVALPNIVIFQILLPLVSPFIDVMFVVGALSYAVKRYFHPLAADPADFIKLVVFFAAFLVIDFIASVIAFLLERREAGQGEDAWLLAHVWLQRFAYRQLFSIVLFKTLKRAIDGRPFSWEKLERTAAVTPVRRAVGASRGS